MRAYVRGRLALDMEDGNLFTLRMLETAEALFGGEVPDLVKHWKKSKDQVIRAPFRKQLERVKRELADAESAKLLTELEVSRRGRWAQSVLTFGALAMLVGMSVFQITSTYLEHEISPVIASLLSRALPAAAAVFLTVLVVIYFRLQSRTDFKKVMLMERHVELSHLLRDLERRRDELEGYVSSSLEEVISGNWRSHPLRVSIDQRPTGAGGDRP